MKCSDRVGFVRASCLDSNDLLIIRKARVLLAYQFAVGRLITTISDRRNPLGHRRVLILIFFFRYENERLRMQPAPLSPCRQQERHHRQALALHRALKAIAADLLPVAASLAVAHIKVVAAISGSL